MGSIKLAHHVACIHVHTLFAAIERTFFASDKYYHQSYISRKYIVRQISCPFFIHIHSIADV